MHVYLCMISSFVVQKSRGTSRKSWYLVEVVVPRGSRGTLWKSWYLVEVVVSCGSRGTSWKSWYVTEVMVRCWLLGTLRPLLIWLVGTTTWHLCSRWLRIRLALHSTSYWKLHCMLPTSYCITWNMHTMNTCSYSLSYWSLHVLDLFASPLNRHSYMCKTAVMMTSAKGIFYIAIVVRRHPSAVGPGPLQHFLAY